MSQTVIPLPVSLEQIAVAVKQMSRSDQYRLLDLVPDLRQRASTPAAQQLVEWPPELDDLRAQVMAALGNRPLTPDEPFMNGLTIGEYLALSNEEEDTLWEQLADVDLLDIDEVEVMPDAVFA